MENKLKNCLCGNSAIAWGQDRVENHHYVHCSKCSRFVEAETKAEAAKLWNAPLHLSEPKTTAAASNRVGYGIY
jgi:hypothetical protein